MFLEEGSFNKFIKFCRIVIYRYLIVTLIILVPLLNIFKFCFVICFFDCLEFSFIKWNNFHYYWQYQKQINYIVISFTVLWINRRAIKSDHNLILMWACVCLEFMSMYLLSTYFTIGKNSYSDFVPLLYLPTWSEAFIPANRITQLYTEAFLRSTDQTYPLISFT